MKALRIFITIYSICSFALFTRADQQENIEVYPIHHASMVIESDGLTIYVDPVGDIALYKGFPVPDMVLITHIHYDHFNADLIKELSGENTEMIGPENVIDELGEGTVMKNGDESEHDKVIIEAVPAYNITPERVKFHPRGRDNGYVLTIGGERIYISGDTEDIPEMRALKDIDWAFLCMNLPYTMTVEQAASAVLAFKPEIVYPYHYKGKDMVSDLDKFTELVSVDPGITVRVLEWYPSGSDPGEGDA